MLKLNSFSDRQLRIIELLSDRQWHEATNIIQALAKAGSSASIKRDLKALYEAGWIEQFGKARATKYRRSLSSQFLGAVDLDKFFSRPQDDRSKGIRFNLDIFSQFKNLQIFNSSEKRKLTNLLNEYRKNIENLTPTNLKREFERVTIDLSWKSSAIEGNTYTLLETETLLKDGIAAEGKSREETAMVINHKSALDFVRSNLAEFKNLTVSKIESVHSQLSKNLGIENNIRKRSVGITGTNYRPLDNEFQIREALENACQLINGFDDMFAKAMLSILFISYIQPFEDGNKRTARLIGNALLLSYNCFPLSFRSVDVDHYKKAILLFYEINNLAEFKLLFIDQAQFAAKEYFR